MDKWQLFKLQLEQRITTQKETINNLSLAYGQHYADSNSAIQHNNVLILLVSLLEQMELLEKYENITPLNDPSNQ
jgi:hypothetical protein